MTAPTTTDLTALKETIRATLSTLIARDIDGRTLATIARFCTAQQEALIAIEAPAKALRSRMKLSGGGLGLASYYGEDVGEDESVALAGAPSSETYGANLIRELMIPLQKALARVSAPPPPQASDLVSALVQATKAKLGEDVIGPLRTKLMQLHVETPEASPPAMIDAAPKNGKSLPLGRAVAP